MCVYIYIYTYIYTHIIHSASSRPPPNIAWSVDLVIARLIVRIQSLLIRWMHIVHSMNIWLYIYIYTHIYIYIYIYIHTYIHTHTYVDST